MRQIEELRARCLPAARPRGDPLVLDAGIPLEVYQTRSPWNHWGPPITLVFVLCLTVLGAIFLWNQGSISLAEIDLEKSKVELEHARLMAADDSWSIEGVISIALWTLFVAVCAFGALPYIIVKCR